MRFSNLNEYSVRFEAFKALGANELETSPPRGVLQASLCSPMKFPSSSLLQSFVPTWQVW